MQHSIRLFTVCNYPMSELIPTATAAMSRILLGFEVPLFYVLLRDGLHLQHRMSIFTAVTLNAFRRMSSAALTQNATVTLGIMTR